MSEENKNAEELEKENKSDEREETNNTNNDINIDGDVLKKVIFSLCYIWGILFFLPLILYKNDSAAKMHANEGLILLLLSIVGNVVFGVLSSFFGWIFGMLAGIYSLLLFLLGLVGIIFVVTDKNQPLPVIGAIKIIK